MPPAIRTKDRKAALLSLPIMLNTVDLKKSKHLGPKLKAIVGLVKSQQTKELQSDFLHLRKDASLT